MNTLLWLNLMAKVKEGGGGGDPLVGCRLQFSIFVGVSKNACYACYLICNSLSFKPLIPTKRVKLMHHLTDRLFQLCFGIYYR